MDQKKLNRLRLYEWILWLLLIVIFLGLIYHSLIFKITLYEIIESILILGFSISMIFLRRSKMGLKIRRGLLKVYGKKVGMNTIVLINIGLGLIFIILAFLTLYDINKFVFNVTLGLGWIIAGLANRHNYYLQITEKSIVKLNLDFLKIGDIKLIIFSSDKVIIKTPKRILEILFTEVKNAERQQIIDDFEDIRIKNNLA